MASIFPPFYDPKIAHDVAWGKPAQELALSYLIRLIRNIYRRVVGYQVPTQGTARYESLVERYGRDINLLKLNHIPDELREDPLLKVVAIDPERTKSYLSPIQKPYIFYKGEAIMQSWVQAHLVRHQQNIDLWKLKNGG